jgi:hypothetical protein
MQADELTRPLFLLDLLQKSKTHHGDTHLPRVEVPGESRSFPLFFLRVSVSPWFKESASGLLCSLCKKSI